MRSLFLSSTDIVGGAARSSYRLYEGLREIGIETGMLVQVKASNTPGVIGPGNALESAFYKIRPHLDALPVRLYSNRPLLNFSAAILPDNLIAKVAALKPEIIHLHWVAGGFIRIETLKQFNRPIIWTLHDEWAFTGGCHYPAECARYKDSCGVCPVLGSKKNNDLSYRVWKRKKESWSELEITVVTPSRWLAECARESSIFEKKRIEVIPYGLNIELYKPLNRVIERKRLGFPQDKKLILFGAVAATTDKRKGYHLLTEAIKKFKNNRFSKDAELVVFGASEPGEQEHLGIKANYMGHIYDDNTLASLYAAVDIFIAPSIQENLSNMVLESLACGTPVIAFDIGGMPDMIDHKKNGYLARAFETKDMADGIAWVLQDSKRWEDLSHEARKKAEQDYELRQVAGRYLDLYNEILR